MDSGVIGLLQQASQASQAAAATANGWITMQFSIGDLTSVGSVIAAYVALRERLARVETKVEPMWDEWNRRHGERRRP